LHFQSITFYTPRRDTGADINLPETVVYNRKKDAQSVTGQLWAELLKENPWYKDVVPDV
jgi:D-amino-acid oxidase